MNANLSSIERSRQRLADDLRDVVADAQALLGHAVAGAGENYENARSQLEQTVAKARAELSALEGAVLEKAGDAARATDRYVHRNPWEAIGIGAGVGLLVGLLLGRR